MTYDWRLPPCKLEERDRYYTFLKHRITALREANNEKVVILGHSMGCKVIHYFLLWVKERFGQKWIDKNIHAMCALGPPFLGAPKSIRTVVSGDRYVII
jgi:phospholipid:diacylglycerol acyltransferase